MFFGLIEIFLVWISGSLIAGWIASFKGNSFKKAFKRSLLFTPLVGIPMAFFSKSNPNKLARVLSVEARTRKL